MASVLFLWLAQVLWIAKINLALWSGFLLYFLVLGLALLNPRKKVPFLPILKVSTWLQIHIYVGLFSIVVFSVHIGWRLPNGILESVLAGVFSVVAISGFIGLFLSRILPQRMTESGEALVYERIPVHRRTLQERMKNLILDVESEIGANVLTDICTSYVQVFLFKKSHIWLCLSSRHRGFRMVRDKLLQAKRYMGNVELDRIDDVLDILDQKRNLDLQFSAMRLLRFWLFLHIPFSASLLILGLGHGLAVLIFGGRF